MRIGIFGNFGWGNIGNSATLEATVAGVRKYLPQAEILCICTNPVEVHRQYGLAVAPVRWGTGEWLRYPEGRLNRLAGKLVQRPTAEVKLWQAAHKVLQQLDLLIIAGTGVLDDFAIGPMDLPFDLLKWSLLARQTNVPLVYLSTGAGPLDHARSRMFVKTALRQAAFRSYRDQFSRQYLCSISFDASADPVYPDLAFGLPVAPSQRSAAGHAGPLVVGLGVMSYSGSQTSADAGEHIYQVYKEKIVRFGAQILANGCSLRLLIGDVQVDRRALDEIAAALAPYNGQSGGELIVAPPAGVSDLLDQLSCTDIVVATRFHNVLLALLLHKPVLSISYNQKNDDLMQVMGLGEFCQPIAELDVERLLAQLQTLYTQRDRIRAQVTRQTEHQVRMVDEQYERVFSLVGSH
jgi:polysaccharide pyruvyl transferase WcaK-like protein